MRTVATNEQSSCKGVYSASEKPLFKAWCFGGEFAFRTTIGKGKQLDCVDGQRSRRCCCDGREKGFSQ